MKIMLLADIHSNWPALRSIDESFDHCLFLGDLVDYGTDPLPCIDWIRRNAHAAVRGNHDHAVAQRVAARANTGFRRLAAATRAVHWELLDLRRLKFLARLPVTQFLELGDLRFLLVHATPHDPMDEYLGNDPDAWSERLQNVDVDFVCTGHTHIPMHVQLPHIQVINPGSVGQPRDGDPRAAYAVLEDGVVHFRRVEYDIDETVANVRASGVESWVADLTDAVLKAGGRLTREEMDSYRPH